MKAAVDADVCTACGLCAETCPDVFALSDDDDAARIIADVVPAEAEEACREAAEECPVDAIALGD